MFTEQHVKAENVGGKLKNQDVSFGNMDIINIEINVYTYMYTLYICIINNS
jgi:hypothetical protein